MIRPMPVALFSCVLLTGCGFPLADEGHAPNATKEQINSFLADCGIVHATVKPSNMEGTTDWVIDFDKATQADLDCLSNKQQAAGVMATTTALIVESY